MATLVRTGRYYSGGTPGVAHVAAARQWAYAADTTSGSGTVIWHTIGARVGRVPGSAGTVTYQLAAMAVTSGQGSGGTRDVPGTVLSRSANQSVSATMDHGGAGVTVRHNLITVITSPRNRRFAFAAASQNNSLAVGMVPAASIGGAHNTWMYERSAPGGVAQSGPGTGSNEGHLAIWMEGDLNERPNTPGVVSRSGGSTNRQPTMTSGFSDPNETLSNRVAYDRLETHRHEVLWGGVVRWRQVYTATATERANRVSQRQIGIQVPFNTTVTYRVWHRDRLGAESAARTLTFSVPSGGAVEAPSQPRGRVTNIAAPGSIVAQYRNNGGFRADRAVVQLLDTQGAPIDFMGAVIVNVAPGGNITVPWGGTQFSLEPGRTYGIRVNARDTSGNWSGYGGISWITTNAPPNIPTHHSPHNGFVSDTVHHLNFMLTDPDQPSSDLRAWVELYTENDQYIDVIEAEPHPTARDRFHAWPGSLITEHQTFKWRMYSYDGYLYSGGSATAAGAARSGMWSYTYAEVPTVTITGPSSPVNTMTPVLTATISDNYRSRVVGRDSNNTIVYDTGEIAGTAHIIRNQFWIGEHRWRNGQTINWTWMARNAAGLWGSSAPHPLTLQYIPPDPLDIETAYAQSLPGVRGTHYAELVHSQPDYGPEDQPTAVWSRVEIDGPGGTEDPATHDPEFVRNTNMGSTNLIDFDMTSGQWYRYGLHLEVTRGADVIESETVYAELMVEFGGVLLHMPFDPLNTFVWLPFGTERYEPEAEWIQGHHEVMSANGRAPFGYSDNMDYVVWRHESVLVPRDDMTPEQQRDAIRRLWNYQNKNKSPNGRPNTVCFREGRSGDDSRAYGRITQPRRVHSYTRLYTVEFEFRELAAMPQEVDDE